MLILHADFPKEFRESRTREKYSNKHSFLDLNIRKNLKLVTTKIYKNLRFRHTKSTSASPAGHGGATGHRTTQGDRGGRADCCGDPNQHPHTRCYNPVFSGQEGVCRVLGGMLQHIYRSGPRLLRPLPGQSALWHHAASFLATSTVAHARNFGTTNYVTRTSIVSGHALGPLRPNLAPN